MTVGGDKNTQVKTLAPGATLGVIGGGQLGRYFVIKARQFGYTVWVLDPDAGAPAMQLASVPLVAAYDDEQALRKLGTACDAVTIEFENVPASSLELLSTLTQVAPASASVQVSQDRLAEKQHALDSGLLPVPHAAILSLQDIDAATDSISFPAILKTSRLGYDGKGQRTCHNKQDVVTAFEQFGAVACVLEQRIDLAAEISVVLARGFDGEVAVFPVAQNIHVDGILFTSVVPALQNEDVISKAGEQACSLAKSVDHVGVLAVEFFIAKEGKLYFNEMAPRPHNSGHYTLDATLCSQFEQQLRVLCAQPLGGTDLLSPVAMLNLLGDVWGPEPPTFGTVFSEPGCHLHLYGKSEARAGRKMGHINCLATDSKSAETLAQRQHEALLI
ncbi:MAG: 5-(carboxyamino)imidazole ribonucleotide synthase [Granulosicoccus sp.]